MNAARLLGVAATASLVILLAGCGDDDSSTTASGPPTTSSESPTAGNGEEQIRAVAERYKTAVRESDAELLCEQVLPPSLLGGGQTEACIDINGYVMEQRGTDLGPGVDLTIDSVEINADQATAQVSDANVDTVDFLKEKGRWWMVVFSEPI